MAEYEILIDNRFCIGCNTCFYKCVQENRLHDQASNGYHRTMVFLESGDQSGKYHHRCMHCDDPVCAAVCTTGAMSKTEYGAVLHEPDICIACLACTLACPFQVPKYDEESKQIVKCSMCGHRIVQGKIPACVEACPTGALAFGEYDMILKAAKGIAAKDGLQVYGVEEQGGTHLFILTSQDPKDLGFPVVPKKSVAAKSKPRGLGGLLSGLINEGTKKA
jgi:Fe-S-cluster-containing dehydrogenase component